MIEFREENLILGDDRDKKKGGSPSFPREKNGERKLKDDSSTMDKKCQGNTNRDINFSTFSVFIYRIAVLVRGP